MKEIRTVLVFLVVAGVCRQKNMSLEGLERASWDSLSPGIQYISTNDKSGIASETDSVELKLKGVSSGDNSLFEISLKTTHPL
jgi:hypothetical protein